MHPVVLGAARAHDHDRSADSLRARRLDQLPAVEAGEHQIEYADVGPLEPQPRQALLAALHLERIEPRCGQVPRHPLRDNLVVLDYEHLGHYLDCDCCGRGSGALLGDREVNGW